jgi:hypothetical protein
MYRYMYIFPLLSGLCDALMTLAENIVLSGDTMFLSFTLAGDEVRERLLTHIIEADVR